MKRKLAHIYYNTAGNSGLYLNPIVEALNSYYEQKAYVNKYYPLNEKNFHRLFFRFTEKNEINPHRLLKKDTNIRKLLRFCELQIGNYQLLKQLKIFRPDIINYSLTNMPDAPYLLKRIRKVLKDVKIVVTCHDVVPFQATGIIDYRTVYELADYLVVHTYGAIEILKREYQISYDKILYHPFPLIDLNRLNVVVSGEDTHSVPRFLFIGVMRQEKGVQVLVNAWKELGPNFDGKLTIAGFRPENVKIDFSHIRNYKNVKIIEKMLSDEEYLKIVKEADYIVFPYSKVGNSGVLSTVVSLKKVPITTKLPTFIESRYCIKELTCNSDNEKELAALIEAVRFKYWPQYNEEQRYIEKELAISKEEYAQSIRNAYRKIQW